MQGNQDMTLDAQQDFSPTAQTTAAGLEAWLSGVNAESTPAAVPAAQPVHAPEPVAVTPAAAEPEAIGPVNLAEAIALGRVSSARKLTGPDGAELVIDPEHDAYHFESTSLKPLQAILQQPADHWTPIYSEALKVTRAAQPAQSLERLRWYAGLVATPGILGRELSRSGQYKLTGWPETEREFPKHFRIAKAMLNETVTADEIAGASGMPYEDVVDYMNASHAAGRLEAVAEKSHGGESAPVSARKGRLMSRLNKPLFAR